MSTPRFHEEKNREDAKPEELGLFFDALKITFNPLTKPQEISVLTDPIAEASGLQATFVKLLQARLINENWEFLQDVRALLINQQGTPEFTRDLRKLGELYFHTTSDKQLNLSSEDFKTLYRLTQDPQRQTLMLQELVSTGSEATGSGKRNVVNEVFKKSIKDNLKGDELTVDMTPYNNYRQAVCLMIAVCDKIEILRPRVESLREYILPAKPGLLSPRSNLDKTGVLVDTSIGHMEKLLDDLEQWLKNAIDAVAAKKPLDPVAMTTALDKIDNTYAAATGKINLSQYQDKLGTNLAEVIKDLKESHQAIMNATKPSAVTDERIKTIYQGVGGLSFYLEQASEHIQMVMSPLYSDGSRSPSSQK